MDAKIFSGDNSKKFWDAVNKSKYSKILYEYGCYAQEIGSQRDDLLAACDEGLAECERVKMDCKCEWKNLDSLLGRIERIEAALAKAT